MKFHHLKLTVILLLSLLSGCKVAPIVPDDPNATLETTTKSLFFEEDGNVRSFEIKATGKWDITTSDSWLLLSKTTGKGDANIEATATKSNSDGVRKAKIVITQGTDLSVEINISQLGSAPAILVDNTRRKLSNMQGELIIEIVSNVECTFNIKEEWLKFSSSDPATNTYKFAYDRNSDGRERNAFIQINGKNAQANSINVSQAAYDGQIPTYTLESFKALSVYGTYISEILTFSFNEYSHQQSINYARKSQRIQTYSQDTLSSLSLSISPSAIDQEIDITYDNRVNGVKMEGSSKVKVIKIEGDKAWLWSESNKAGFIVNISK